MDLLERYLQAVGEHLPAGSKADTLAELKENLLAEMEGREEELGRPLTDAETAEVLEKHGRPILVASRYLPQQYLIGPQWFPIYWFTLRRSFPFVVLAYAVVQVLAIVMNGWAKFDCSYAVFHFFGVAVTFWAWMTAGFAFFEFAQGRYFQKVSFKDEWKAKDLPPVNRQVEKPRSLANGIADVIVSGLVLGWLLLLPQHPALVLGPAVGIVRTMPFGITPEWHIFYWQIVGLSAVQLVLKVVMLAFNGSRKLRQGMNLGVHAVGILVLAVMVQARTYFVQGTAATSMSYKDLASINNGINLGFKIGLAVAVVTFLWELWKMLVNAEPNGNGCVTAR